MTFVAAPDRPRPLNLEKNHMSHNNENRSRREFLTAAGAVVAAAGAVAADEKAVGGGEKKPVKPANAAGAWTGVWGPYSPADPAKPEKYTQAQKQLDCKVVQTGEGKYQATFEGECGRPYKYTITMPGRQAGAAVLFQGSADLGEADGGVFDWIGRATDKEFVGFFSSKAYTGTFSLKRAKQS